MTELTRWRSMQVCDACWERKYPGRPALRLKQHVRESTECFGCEQTTTSGIYVRVQVRWP